MLSSDALPLTPPISPLRELFIMEMPLESELSAYDFQLELLTVADEVEDLVEDVAALNLQGGIDNSLDTKLDAVLNALDDVNANNDVAACNSIQAFINAVQAQADNKIPQADADYLIAEANEILSILGCP